MTDVTAVICAYGDQPHLHDVIASLRASEQVSVEILVVDNGSPDCADLPDGVVVVEPGWNTGFSGGCNLGARHAKGTTLVFVNSDAVVDAHCLALLHEHAADGDVVGATILVADEPDTVNSWGNPVHLLGFSWAGGYGHPAAEATGGAVASVSGAVFAVRRDAYLQLGGMDDEYFAYGEDVDVSLRAWLSGRQVRVLSAARAWHHYDFSRNPAKMYLLERNRLITVLTTYQARTLVALAPLLLAAETGLLVRSRREGWSDQKLAGWRWLAAHRRYLRARRNRLQGTRRVPDAQVMARMTLSLDPPRRFGMSIPASWQGAIDAYWRVIGAPLAGVRPAPVESRGRTGAGH